MYDAAAVAFGGTALGQGRELLHGLALGGCLGSRCNAGLALAIERLRHGCRTAHLAQRENLNLKLAALVFDDEVVAGMDLAGRLGLVSVGEDAAQVAGLGGQSAGFEEARRPEPFVDPEGVQGSIVVQNRKLITPNLLAEMWITPERLKWEHSIFSSVVCLYGRPDGRDMHHFFPTGNES